MNPRVKKLTPLPGYKLDIEFPNGEQGIYNCTPLLDFGVFKELKGISYFKRVKVAPDYYILNSINTVDAFHT